MAKLPFWLKTESMKPVKDGFVWTIRMPWYGWPFALFEGLKNSVIETMRKIRIGRKQ